MLYGVLGETAGTYPVIEPVVLLQEILQNKENI